MFFSFFPLRLCSLACFDFSGWLMIEHLSAGNGYGYQRREIIFLMS